MPGVCPYLKTVRGALQAPQTYPTHQHRCTVHGKDIAIAPELQMRLCLSGQYHSCPFFCREPVQPVPDAQTVLPLAPVSESSKLEESTLGMVLVAIVAVVLVVLIAFWLAPRLIKAEASAITITATVFPTVLADNPTATPVSVAAKPRTLLQLLATRTPTPTLTPTSTLTPTPTSTPTSTPTPTFTPTFTPTPTVTPTPLRPPADQLPDRIVIPSINLDSKIVQVSRKVMQVGDEKVLTWEVADYAVSFHKDSAYPGHVGNTVLSGHNNILGEVFRYLVDVEVGDQVMLYVGDRGYPYVIEEKMVLPDRDVTLEQRQENARWIESFPDERVTMVTCWPYTGNSHRVIVIAKPPPEPQNAVVTLPLD